MVLLFAKPSFAFIGFKWKAFKGSVDASDTGYSTG
jgi:hypothetical protein